MCDPVTLGIGLASSVAGNALTSNSNIQNAKNQAAAANAVLSQNIAQQEGYSAQDEGLFNGNVSNYAPTTQASQLSDAQTARGNTDAANITQPDTADIPGQATAPAAETKDIASRMGSVLDLATKQAKAQGALGGYGDSWLTNQMNNAATNRAMAPINAESQLSAQLLPEEQQVAEAGAYTQPSPWGSLLSGIGSIAGAAAGSAGANGLTGKVISAFTPS